MVGCHALALALELLDEVEVLDCVSEALARGKQVSLISVPAYSLPYAAGRALPLALLYLVFPDSALLSVLAQSQKKGQ